MDRIKYTCEGPRKYVKDKMAELAERISKLEKLLTVTPKNDRTPIAAKLKDAKEELARLKKRPEDEYLGRAGCGWNLTAQIAAIPDDGEVYEYQCPKCGNRGTVHKTVPAVSN